MTYDEAKQLIEFNNHLIGKKHKGLTIDEIVAHPIDKKAHEEFVNLYLQTYDGSKAILPFAKFDLGVYCVFDKGRIMAQGIFLHGSLKEVSKELDVVFLDDIDKG